MGWEVRISDIKNYVVLVPVFGAVALFLVNYILKSKLAPVEYGEVAVYLFISSLLYIGAGMGFEQVIVRSASVSESLVIIDRNVLITSGLLVFLSMALSLFFGHYFLNMNRFGIALLAGFVALSVYLSALGRLSGHLLAAYLAISMWKVLLLVFALLSIYVVDHLEFDVLLLLSIIFGFLVSIVAFFKQGGLVVCNSSRSYVDVFLMSAGAIVSVVGYAFFDSMDRLILEGIVDREEFGEYYFYYVFIVSPSMIFASYFSSRKLNGYKSNFRLPVVYKDCALVVLLSFLFSMFMAFILIFLDFLYVDVWSGSYSILFWLVVLSAFRGGYSVISIAYNVVCRTRSLFITGVFSVLISMFFYLFARDVLKEVETVVVWVVFFWALRISYVVFIMKSDLRRSVLL